MLVATRKATGTPSRKPRRRLTKVGLYDFDGKLMGTIRVVVKPGGVWDLRPGAVGHWSDAERATFLAWDDLYHNGRVL